jgi:hypothetical protein
MNSRASSEEAYVLALCDEILGHVAERQKRFDFIRGDPGRSGIGRKLPVDGFYPVLMLAVEYRETQHSRPVEHFDKPGRLTVSGVHRGEQRRLYDQRRRDILPSNGIRLIEIDCNDLSCDKRSRLLRDTAHDRHVITARLS